MLVSSDPKLLCLAGFGLQTTRSDVSKQVSQNGPHAAVYSEDLSVNGPQFLYLSGIGPTRAQTIFARNFGPTSPRVLFSISRFCSVSLSWALVRNCWHHRPGGPQTHPLEAHTHREQCFKPQRWLFDTLQPMREAFPREVVGYPRPLA